MGWQERRYQKAFAMHWVQPWKADHTQENVGESDPDEIGFWSRRADHSAVSAQLLPVSEPEDGAADQGNAKAGKESPLNQDPIDSLTFRLAGAGSKLILAFSIESDTARDFVMIFASGGVEKARAEE